MRQQISPNTDGVWLLCSSGKLWLPRGQIPQGTAAEHQVLSTFAYPVGVWQEKTVWLVREEKTDAMQPIITLVADLDTLLFQLVGKAMQLAHFYDLHQYCSCCGHDELHESNIEWSYLCPRCQHTYYPQIMPAVIVAVRRDDHLLLANHARHQHTGLYTVLAGFVEVGETLEETVKREVFEETKIKIKSITPMGSQSWPFPSTLMIGYIAEYESGDICVDKNELLDARWYHYNKLPLLPGNNTIARQLIDLTIQLCRNA